jgi:hypothetical protein
MQRDIVNRPQRLNSGDVGAILSRRSLETSAEEALGIWFVCHRRLFGHCYYGVMDKFAYTLGRGDGVFVSLSVDTKSLVGRQIKPGDVDLLVVPYKDDQLILDFTLAIELKVIRATFETQGKSPNQMGVSQGTGLLKAGFPFAAVYHLIVSDDAPSKSYTQMMSAKITDESGRAEVVGQVMVDYHPAELIRRSFGRLKQAAEEAPSLGLATAFVGTYSEIKTSAPTGLWIPEWKEATRNKGINTDLLKKVADHFEINSQYYMDIPAG